MFETRTMAKKRKLTIETLTQLGADKLAELLLAGAARNRHLKQTLNLAISAKEGPAALGASLRKRLVALANSHSMLSYDPGRELIAELDGLRATIVEMIGAKDSGLALDLLWQFLELHPSTLERVDDSSGRMGDVFRTASDELGPLAERAKIEPEVLAATVFEKVANNGYGIYDGLIMSVSVALGQKGRAALRALLLQSRQQHLSQDRRSVLPSGRHDFSLTGISLALRAIADCEGDADAFIDSYQDRQLTNPLFASEIALQLLRSGRAEEALSYLDRAPPSPGNPHFGHIEWTNARIAVLDALQRTEEAQTLRLAFFQARLGPSHLRDYLDRLSDFDDFEAEERELDMVAEHANVHAALAFLVDWPAHERAARLVQLRIKEIDGDSYELLDPAASILEGKYPLAAVLLRRALIEVALNKGRATRYKHAARHVREIESLNAQIEEYAGFETHQQFMARLQKTHPRKTGFWPLLRDSVSAQHVRYRMNTGSVMLTVSSSGFVQGFGCRPCMTLPRASWPASESRQRRNPRAMARGRRRALCYGDLADGPVACRRAW